MLHVSFIFPSSNYLFDPFRGDPHTHFQILTVLEEHFGDSIQLSLVDLRGVDTRFALYRIPEADVYLHSVYTLDYNEQVSLIEKLRIRYPKALHLAGGPHANMFQQECLKIFDALVLGDGEESIVRAVKDIMDSDLQTIYRQSQVIDINDYPYPRRHWLPSSTIAREGLLTLKHRDGFDKLLSTTVIFSRGCPYKCCFCEMQISERTPGIRYRTPQSVEQEIEYLKSDYGIEGVSLLDEIGIPLKKAEAISFLEAVGRTNIVWRAQCRVDGITPDLAHLARDAGCVTLCMGVESVSQQSLDIINKKISVEQAKRSIAHIKEYGIEVRIYLIIGLPGEPEDIVERTWSFIKETDPDLVYLSLFTIRPGTQVFNSPEKFGIKKIDKKWEDTMHMFGRYEDEVPKLTFEYEQHTPWGNSFSNDMIISNYMELQARLKNGGLNRL